MRSTILIGYMCVGKTTVGRDLAKRTGRMFYDLDWYIEERYHRKVAAIFAEDGEEFFRDLEKRMLHEVAEFENIVLACGGGTPCFYDNMAYMNSVGETFFMKASPNTILEHLKVSKGKRPLLEGKSREELEAYIISQLAYREPFYEQAKHIIDVNPLDSFDKIQSISNQIIQLENSNTI